MRKVPRAIHRIDGKAHLGLGQLLNLVFGAGLLTNDMRAGEHLKQTPRDHLFRLAVGVGDHIHRAGFLVDLSLAQRTKAWQNFGPRRAADKVHDLCALGGGERCRDWHGQAIRHQKRLEL